MNQTKIRLPTLLQLKHTDSTSLLCVSINCGGTKMEGTCLMEWFSTKMQGNQTPQVSKLLTVWFHHNRVKVLSTTIRWQPKSNGGPMLTTVWSKQSRTTRKFRWLYRVMAKPNLYLSTSSSSLRFAVLMRTNKPTGLWQRKKSSKLPVT